MKLVTPELRDKRTLFAQRLPLIMDEAGRLGLFATMQALHKAVQAVGYEVANEFSESSKKTVLS